MQDPSELRAEVERVLGVIQIEAETLDDQVEALLVARKAARESKDWAASDRIRDELAALKVVIQDTPEGTIWRRQD